MDTRRDTAVDHARGMAVLIMIQAHAFDAWVSPDHKSTMAYGLTRLFATLPLPAFLVLAGAAVAYRVRVKAAQQAARGRVASALVGRGLQVVLIGYLVSAVYAAMDGGLNLVTVLRADVLHVIGLSIATLGACVGRGAAPVTTRSFAMRVATLGAAATLVCAPLTTWSTAAAGLSGDSSSTRWSMMFRAPWALLVDLPPLTQMPLVPLFTWVACGALAGLYVTRPSTPQAAPRPPRASTGRLLQLCGMALVAIAMGAQLTDWLMGQGPLTRASPAVVGNVIEYAGRGLLVLGLAPILVARLPAGAQGAVRHLGQASLWAYVFHIPFCYGQLGRGLVARHSVTSALPAVAALAVASYAIVELRLAFGRRSTAVARPARAR